MIREKRAPKEIVIDLTGPDGNAFALMGHAKSFAKQLGFTPEEITAMLNDMMSSDYEHLVQVFDDRFGLFVVLER